MSTTYKEFDELTPSTNTDCDRLAPNMWQKRAIQTVYDLYAKYGEESTLSDLLALLSDSNPCGAIYEDLTGKIELAHDPRDFTGDPLPNKLLKLRNEVNEITRHVQQVTLTDQQAATLSIVNGEVVEDKASKLALYPVILTEEESSMINGLYTIVDTVNAAAASTVLGDPVRIKVESPYIHTSWTTGEKSVNLDLVCQRLLYRHYTN